MRRRLTAQKITVNIGGQAVETSAVELGFSWSNQDVMDDVAAAYTGGNLIRQYMKSADLKKSPESIPLETSVDEEKVKAFIESKYSGLVQAPQDAAITRENGEFVITPSTPGVMIDVEATNAALQEAFQADLKEAVEVEAALTESQPRIRTEDLETHTGSSRYFFHRFQQQLFGSGYQPPGGRRKDQRPRADARRDPVRL